MTIDQFKNKYAPNYPHQIHLSEWGLNCWGMMETPYVVRGEKIYICMKGSYHPTNQGFLVAVSKDKNSVKVSNKLTNMNGFYSIPKEGIEYLIKKGFNKATDLVKFDGQKNHLGLTYGWFCA